MKTKPYIGVLAANGGREKFMATKGPLRDLLGTRYRIVGGPFKSEHDAMEMLMLPHKAFPKGIPVAVAPTPEIKITTSQSDDATTYGNGVSIVRLPPLPKEQKARYMAAAKASGKGLAEWMLAACDQQANGTNYKLFLALRDVAGDRMIEQLFLPCHYGITTVDKCGRCTRERAAFEAMDKY